MAGSRKGTQEINASSMADIAFLLLIFFLVTTTIDQDRGILHKLPAWTDVPPPDAKSNQRNVLEILVNLNDQILCEGEWIDIGELRPLAIKHIDNRGKLPNFSDSPKDAIVSLKNDRGTTYGVYIEIQNELKAAYAELRNKMALKLTNGSMNYYEIDACTDNAEQIFSEAKVAKCEQLKDQIQEEYPMKISEAEPVNLGK